MRQLTCTGPGEVAWREVAEPAGDEPTDALVRPIAVARCEIDPLLVLAGPTSPVGFAVGHEAVAEVVDLGDGVDGLAVGDLVLPSFQVSCGVCATCRRGRSALLRARTRSSRTTGCSRSRGPSTAACSPTWCASRTPPRCSRRSRTAIDPVAAASVPDNVLDGYRSVAPHLREQPGADVLVVIHGNRSIGLYAVHSALALGAGIGHRRQRRRRDARRGRAPGRGDLPHRLRGSAGTTLADRRRLRPAIGRARMGDPGDRARRDAPQRLVLRRRPDRPDAAGSALHARHLVPHRTSPLGLAPPRGGRRSSGRVVCTPS